MARVSTNISLDKDLKKKALKVLDEIGMDLSSFVSMSLRQMIRNQSVYFDLSRFEPNKETLEAMKECDDMFKHPNKYKRYNTVDELFEDLNA